MRLSRVVKFAAEAPGNAWFDKNLKFGCTQCGKCCTSITINKYNNMTAVDVYSSSVYINEAEGKAISNTLKLTKKQFYDNYTKEIEDNNGDVYTTLTSKPSKHTVGSECIFLENKKCSIYNARPTQCRTYPFWPSIMSESEWNLESKSCEGIDGDNDVRKDIIVQNMIIHEIHNRGNGENWSYDESVEYLKQSILNEPELVSDYEKEFFKVKESNTTLYIDGELSVIDNVAENTRRLEFTKCNNINQSEVKLDPATQKINHNALVMPVHQVIFDIISVLTHPINNMLLIGGGGLSLSSYISNHDLYKGTRIDVIEPNMNVILVAKRFFDPIITGEIWISKGEDVLHKLSSEGANGKNYEVIIIDAFADNVAPPASFLEVNNVKNLLQLLHNHIQNTIIINVYGGMDHKDRVVLGIKEHLRVDYNINVLVVKGDGDTNNYVLFISNKKLDGY